MTFEYYSSLALVSSVVVYALAMFAHAAEWAAARRLGGTEPAARDLVDVAAVGRGDGQLRPDPAETRDQLGNQAGLVTQSETDLAARRVAFCVQLV